MAYTEVFGGTNIYPADVSFLHIDLVESISLDWPLESAAPPYPLARIIDVMATDIDLSMTLPNATQAGPGQVVLFNNLTGSIPCFVRDFGGNIIATLGVGEQWQFYLVDNDTSPGLWHIFQMGASTATVQPSALAGYGIVVTGSTLSQSIPVNTFNVTPRNLLDSDRASAFVWTGSGSGTIMLPGVASVGNNWFASARNAGGGDLTLDPLGSETIDGAASLTLSPGEGIVVITDGLQWFTLGLGQAAVFAFDYTVIDLTGSGPTYTLTGSELNRVAYKFTGALTTNVTVIVPPTIQQYWVDNSTTGAFTLGLSTLGGTPSVVPQGARGIYYSDGTDVVDADTATISLPVNASDGGTGISSYTIGDLIYASGVTTLSKLSDVAVGNVLNAGGVGLPPFWGKVDLATTVSGILPPANGGTGVAGGYAENRLVKGNAGGSLVSTANIYEVMGRLGVNIAAPVDALDIYNNGAINTPLGLRIGIVAHGLDQFAARVQVDLAPGGVPYMLITAPTDVNASMLFRTGNPATERMRITPTGELCVGTTAGASKVTVFGNLSVLPLAARVGYDVDGGGSHAVVSGVDSALYGMTVAAPYTGMGNPGTQIHGFGGVILGTNGLERVRVDANGTTTLVSGSNVTPGVIVQGGSIGAGWLRLGNNLNLQGGDDYLGLTITYAAAPVFKHTNAFGGQINKFNVGDPQASGAYGQNWWPNVQGATCFYARNLGDSYLRLGVGTIDTPAADVVAISGASLQPVNDNAIYLGSAGARWKEIFAGNPAINTSDARQKDWRGGLTEAELRAAKTVAKGIGTYRWLDAIEAKGDGARLHVGVMAQNVIAAMEAEGLDPFAYGFVCYDQWDAVEAIEGAPGRAAGDAYGVRYGELAMFIAAAQEQRLAALEAALA